MRVPAKRQRTVLPFPDPRLRSWGLALVLLFALVLSEAAVESATGRSAAEAATRKASGAASRKSATKRPRPAARRIAAARTTAHRAAYRAPRRSRPVRRGHARRHRSYARYGSRAAFIMDARTGEILFEKNAGSPLPVASLTKLMTDIVFLETDPDLEQSVTILREDVVGAGKTQLRSGEVVTVRQLLYHSLMSSDNAATEALVRASGVARDEYLARMNRRAAVLGLHNTRFVEFTGLDPANMSSAADVAQLLRYASDQPLISEITSQPDYEYRSSRRVHRLVNSNRLARYGQMDVRSGKTGFIQSAGYCVATWVRDGSRDLIAVVLGAPSKQARFNETRRLLQQVGLAGSSSAGLSGAAKIRD